MNTSLTLPNRIVIFICYLYILLFTYAAVSKLLDFENFQVQLGQSPLLSAFALWISWLVLFAELLIALLLVIPKFRLIGLLASIIMMTMFSVYIFIVLHYSSFVPCSCGGILEKMSWDVHLIFNITFLLLGLLALFLEKLINQNKSFGTSFISGKTTILSIAGSVPVVVILFLYSEQIMHQENPFIRRYPQHPVMLEHSVNLKFNSYYFAGKSENGIYLGNYANPLHIIFFDTVLKNKKDYKISFITKNKLFKRVKILVRGSYFYLTDGTVPCIFWGSIKNWKITNEIKGCHYFSLAEPVDNTAILFRSNNGKNAAHILSTYKTGRNPHIIYNDTLLQKQIDGIFDTDGMLAYNEKMKRMVYLYYYRNGFIVTDQNLHLLYRNHTIDTFSHAKIKVAYLENNTERKMSAPPLVVNASLALCQNLLFVNSKIQGRFENKKLWDQAEILDVYNLDKKSYIMSFALYHLGDKKLQSFMITNNYLYAMMGDDLGVYKLRDILKKEMTVPE